MRCASCSKISFEIICKKCQYELFTPQIHTRRVGDLDVICFYNYSSIDTLLHYKHTNVGYRVFKKLSKMVLQPFIKEFVEHQIGDIHIIAVDEKVKNGYSHTALLSHTMKMKSIIPYHSKLLASNDVTYSGKSLQYRLDNPREFRYRGKKSITAVLVDDIITSGITLKSAYDELRKHNVDVLFALVLADARE
jgi:competence protein ComFC